MGDNDPPNTMEHRQALPRDLPPLTRNSQKPEIIELTARSEKSSNDSSPPQADVHPLRPAIELQRCKTLTEFVEKNVYMRECKCYIINPKTGKCGCNRDSEWHEKNEIPAGVDKKWTPSRHTSLKPTNAHGKIKLHGFGRLRAGEKPKYIRVDALIPNFEMIWSLLISHWNVPPPDIVLSINGGAKKMAPMTQRLRVALKKGLMNVVTSARTWFVTPGFNLGVAKLVGEAVREYSLATTKDNSFITIGFATWGAVYNRQLLINKGNDPDDEEQETTETDNIHIADYYNCIENPGKGQAVLDPHHSHFILCDDGTERCFNREIDFRAEFENFVTEKMTAHTCGSPVIQVVIEGGKKTIQTAHAALKQGTPVVVIQGSGRCADLLCTVWERTNPKMSRDTMGGIISELLDVYREEWVLQTEREFDGYVENMIEMVVNHRSLLHVFNVDGVSKELDRAILLAVFKSSRSLTTQGQLSLAMNLNRCDLAAQEIFADDKSGTWKQLDLNDAMFEALRKGQTEFVELFLDHGISIENFLDTDKLTHLYLHALTDKYITREGEELREIIENIKTPWWNYLIRCCRKQKFQDYEKDLLLVIGRVIQVFTGDTMPNPYFYDAQYSPHVADEEVEVVRVTACGPPILSSERGNDPTHGGEPQQFQMRQGVTLRKRPTVYPNYPPRSNAGKRLYTEQDLFMWAVLLNRMDLAKVFWRMGKDHIGSALVACAMFDQLQIRAESDGEMELAVSLGKNSDYFEMLATGILSMAYQQDKDRTHLLLIRGLPYYGNETLLSLADQNECMDFMGHTAVQTKLNRIWMGGMSPYVPVWKVCLNILLAPVFIRLIFPSADSHENTVNKVEPVLGSKHMLNAEYIDSQAPNARELRETVAAQQAAISMDPKSRETYLEQFRWRQQHSWKHVSYLQALHLYYTAPITKFILNTFSYVVFLLLMCYMVMVELKPFPNVVYHNVTCNGVIHLHRYCIPPIEMILWIWTFTLILEELRQIFMRDQRSIKYKLYDWISSGWNKFDCLLYVLFITVIILRFVLSDSLFVSIRCIYALIMVMFFLRFMQTYYAHRVIGPKVVMITKMVNDISFFLAIFIIFLLAYGTAAQALLYPNHHLNAELLKKVFYYPYWQVFGELTLDEVEGTKVGQTPNAMVIVFFAIYMLFTNVLLLNLLIAMFGYTFENVQSSSLKIWAYNRYDLILEYFDRPSLPPPFIIIAIISRVVRYCVAECRVRCCRNRREKTQSDFKVILDLQENQMMSAFEQQCMERLMASMDTEISLEQGTTGMETERIDSIADQVSVLRDIIEKKAKQETYSETQVDGRTPRTPKATDPNYHEFMDEVSKMRLRLRGLEDKLSSQTAIMENIHEILDTMVNPPRKT